jgi:hypothetical protein
MYSADLASATTASKAEAKAAQAEGKRLAASIKAATTKLKATQRECDDVKQRVAEDITAAQVRATAAGSGDALVDGKAWLSLADTTMKAAALQAEESALATNVEQEVSKKKKLTNEQAFRDVMHRFASRLANQNKRTLSYSSRRF